MGSQPSIDPWDARPPQPVELLLRPLDFLFIIQAAQATEL
jgi:hypothetical protein